jgi:hypothetical protein
MQMLPLGVRAKALRTRDFQALRRWRRSLGDGGRAVAEAAVSPTGSCAGRSLGHNAAGSFLRQAREAGSGGDLSCATSGAVLVTSLAILMPIFELNQRMK